jgi:hypothetical protein
VLTKRDPQALQVQRPAAGSSQVELEQLDLLMKTEDGRNKAKMKRNVERAIERLWAREREGEREGERERERLGERA